MVKIRLRRTGAKKKPSYRVVVAESTSPRDGRFIEVIGHYQPQQDPPYLEIKEDRLFHWLSVGAQPSDSMHRILTSKDLMAKFEQFKNAPAPESVSIEENVVSENSSANEGVEAETASEAPVEA